MPRMRQAAMQVRASARYAPVTPWVAKVVAARGLLWPMVMLVHGEGLDAKFAE